MASTDGKDRPEIPVQVLLPGLLTLTASLLIAAAALFLGQDRLGNWYYPMIAVAVVINASGQVKLVKTITEFARARRETRQDDGGNS
jgi:hypothetical protein